MAASSHLSRVCPLVRIKVIETKNKYSNKKKQVDRTQSQQIAALNKKVSQLATLASIPKKARRKVRKVFQRQAVTSRNSDPVIASVQAAVRPFDTPKGIAGPLAGLVRPSQKFTAKAATSVSIPAGCTMVFMQDACIASNSIYPSVILAVQTASGTAMSGPFKSSTVGDLVVAGGTLSRLSTNTPYAATTLASNFEWQLVGAGLKFSYEGTLLNQSGTFMYLHDPEEAFNQGWPDWTGKGPSDVISFINTAHNAIRQNILEKRVVEINCMSPDSDTARDANLVFIDGSTGAALGGSTSTTFFGTAPVVLGYFINSSSATISFHVETIEHWAVASPTIQALHTDSIAHPILHSQVVNFLGSARQMHASKPNSDHVDVMRTVKKGMGSPLGHELINTALTAALA